MKVTDCGHFIFPGPNFVSPEWKCSLVSQRRGSNVIWDRYLDKESHSWGWDISTSSFVNIIKAFLLSLKLDKRVSVFMSFQGCGQARIKRSIKLLVLLGSYFYGSFDWGTFVFEIRWNLFFRKSIPQLFFAWKDSLVARDNSQWPLCVITSSSKFHRHGLVYQQNSSHLHSLCVGILFNSTALGIHSFKTLQLYILIGGEIYSSDVNTHKGYSLIYLKKIP